MRMPFCARLGLAAMTAAGLLAVGACGTNEPAAPPSAVGEASKPVQQIVPPLPGEMNEIPPDELSAVMAAHYLGLGSMERFEYSNAVAAFRDVRKRAPGWIPGSINLAIALLNDSGQKAEEAKKAGAVAEPDNFGEALDLLGDVLNRDTGNPYAHFCRGLILQQQGALAAAHEHFKRVTDIDPKDAAAWYWMGRTIPEPAEPPEDRLKAIKERSKREVELFSKALELNPNLTQAIYGFAMAARFVKSEKETKEWFDRFRRINPDQDGSVPAPGPGDPQAKAYGDMGRYGTIVNPFPQVMAIPEGGAQPAPRFEAVVPLR